MSIESTKSCISSIPRLGFSALVLLLLTGCGKEQVHPNFNSEIAPIFAAHCTRCHSSDGTTPFSLETYKECAEQLDKIATVVQKGTMPPWLPVHKSVAFRDKPTMSDADRKTILQWIGLKAPEGKRSRESKKVSHHETTWQIGEPDLVIELPAFEHTASDLVTFRTLVAQIPIEKTRQVRAMEILPDRAKAIQHAILLIDSTNASLRRDAEDASTGYTGKGLPTAQAPQGHMMFWKAGKKVHPVDPGLTWQLHPSDSLAIELSLNPVTKPETVRVRIGIHFSGSAASKQAFGLRLHPTKPRATDGDALQTHFESYTLPVDATLTRLMPDIDIPCNTVRVTARKASGQSTKLLTINNWNSAHQDDFVLKQPYVIEKGTALRIELVCDERVTPPSPENVALWAQVLVKDAAAIEVLQEDAYRYILATHPSASHHYLLAEILQGRRAYAEAIDHYTQAIQLESPFPDTLQRLAYCQMNTGQFKNALSTTEQAIPKDPDNTDLLCLRGKLLMALNQADEALAEYQKVLKIDPENNVAQGQINLLKHRKAHE